METKSKDRSMQHRDRERDTLTGNIEEINKELQREREGRAVCEIRVNELEITVRKLQLQLSVKVDGELEKSTGRDLVGEAERARSDRLKNDKLERMKADKLEMMKAKEVEQGLRAKLLRAEAELANVSLIPLLYMCITLIWYLWSIVDV
jgi:hypothetical protein